MVYCCRRIHLTRCIDKRLTKNDLASMKSQTDIDGGDAPVHIIYEEQKK